MSSLIVAVLTRSCNIKILQQASGRGNVMNEFGRPCMSSVMYKGDAETDYVSIGATEGKL